MTLKDYKRKRKFTDTPEPKATRKKTSKKLQFVVQEHHASHLHYDFRLEMNGVLKSWAVPKGPSLNPKEKRLAIQVEDHPFAYKDFAGVIPAGNYGAGTVSIWDKGTYELLTAKGIEQGHLSIMLHGKKLNGEFSLVKLKNAEKNQWLLIKKDDAYAQKSSIIKSNMPKNIKPMLAHVAAQPFSRKGWIFEIKWDGYRIIAYLRGKKTALLSRNQQDYSNVFAAVTAELAKLRMHAIFDGEMVVVDPHGQSRFQLLQQFKKTGEGQLIYYVFDLLWLNGEDLRSLPLQQRKKLLAEILPELEHVKISDHIAETGQALFALAAKNGLEGIIAKEGDSPYLAGIRSHAWLKMKVKQQQTAIICGYTAPRGSRSHLGALILGIYKNNRLTYIGHTSGKLSEAQLADLKAKLDKLAQPKSPFSHAPKTNAAVTWVKPILTAEINFSEWTRDGQLRQPIFIRLGPIQSEEKLTHLTKIYWPQQGYTKGELIEYYHSISTIILPYLKDRPQSLNRHPNGIDGANFFQKNMDKCPTWIKTKVMHSTHAHHDVRYLLCQNEATLIYMANLGCIEINPWLSRIKSANRPDFCVLDLDPENIGFNAVIKTAQYIHRLLEKINVANYCKTSGKRGLHIIIPLGAKYDYDQSKIFAELIATIIHRQLPEITSLIRSPTLRQGKVYIDFLQNRPKQTIVAPYSVRPVIGATVSTPLRWTEVTSRLNPAKFTMKNMRKRLDKIGDIWENIMQFPLDLPRALSKLKKYQ